MISESELGLIHRFVLDLFHETRKQIAEKVRTGYFHSVKEDKSQVTDVDRSIELFLRDQINRRFPSHGFVGEEHSPDECSSEFVWYVDPIDGTQNFTHSIPTYGTIIALHAQGQPIVGAIDHPRIDETVSAARGLGAYLNGNRLTLPDLTRTEEPCEELVTVASPANFARTGDFDILFRFVRSHPNIRIYGDCFGQNAAFTGKAGGSVQFNVKVWDIAAAQLLIEEAGGAALPLRQNHNHPQGNFHGMLLGKKRMVEYLRPFFAEFI